MKNIKNSLLIVLPMILLISSTACSPAVATPLATSAPAARPLPSPSPAPTMQPGDTTRELTINDTNRKYYLHIPPGLAQDQPVPVVLIFHEFTYPVSQTRAQTHLDEIADKNSFITVYPVGTGTSWNAGTCCGTAVQDQVDEIAFVRQILTDLGSVVKVDSKRIYATGFSNGAMLAYRLACEMSDTFAAVAPVEGDLVSNPCQPQQPVSILHVHGLNDPYVPFEGGSSSPDCGSGCPATFPPVKQGLDTWAQLNGCTGTPQSQVDGAITHITYPCPAGTAIELYTLDGMEHAWPQPSGSGKFNFPASQTIWDFFAAHPKS